MSEEIKLPELVQRLRWHADAFEDADPLVYSAKIRDLREAAAALAAPAHADEPVARYAGVDMSRFTIEWLIEPDTTGMGQIEKLRTLAYKERVPVGTLFYARPAGIRSEVIEKAKALLAKLDAIHGNEKYKSVWAVNQIHAGPYTGPQYTDELFALREAIRALGESS